MKMSLLKSTTGIEDLTTQLAQRVMGWEAAPDRFLLGERRWLPRWRFQPTEKLEDAFRLLDAAAPQNYKMGREAVGLFWVRVRIAGKTGEAQSQSKPQAITLAIARALRIPAEG